MRMRAGGALLEQLTVQRGDGKGGVEPQGLVIVAQRVRAAAQGDERQGAVVEAAGRLRGRADADAVRRDGVAVPARNEMRLCRP